MSTQFERFVVSVCSCKSSKQKRERMFAALCQRRELDEIIVSLAYELGLGHLLPNELRQRAEPSLWLRAPATALLDYLPTPEAQQYCLHRFCNDASLRFQLYVGAHELLKDCLPCSFTDAQNFALHIGTNQAFSILLDGFAIRHIDVFSDNTAIAVGYGPNRSWPLATLEIGE